LRPLEPAVLPDMEAAFGSMAEAIAAALTREVGATDVRVGRSLHLRFKGQRHFVRTTITDDADIPAIRKTFEDIYRQRYGYVEPNSPIEIVSLSVTALADLNGPALEQLRPPAAAGGTSAPLTRAVYFQEAGKRVDTPVFKRADLPPGFTAVGPAVIEEYGTSTVIAPGDPFSIGRLGEIRIQCA
jgi:N-methylhydantoinase A